MTLAFMTLAFAQTLHLANARRDGPLLSRDNLFSNRWAFAAVALVTVLQVTSAHFPPLARVLGTVPLSGKDWIVVLLLSLVPAVVGQTVKLLGRRQRA